MVDVLKSERHSFWERVLTQNAAGLSQFLLSRAAHIQDVDDLAQEVYLRLLRVGDDKVNDITNPQAYLFTVASNLIKEQAIAHQQRRLHVDIDKVIHQLAAGPDESPEDEADRRIRYRHIADAFERLPPRCRDVLSMQHRDGMSYASIAERLGVSSHMVKKYVVRALAICRQELGGLK